MPKLEDNDMTKAESPEDDGVAHSLGFEAKLIQAHERRERILEARRAEADARAKRDSRKSWVRIRANANAHLASTLQSLSKRRQSGLAAKALLVFVGSLGFGLGLSFGLSAISAPRDFAGTAALQAATPETEAGFSETGMLNVAAEKSAVLDGLAETAGMSLGAFSYESLQSPERRDIEFPPLPEITKVKYLSAAFAMPEAPKPESSRVALRLEDAQKVPAAMRAKVYLHAPDGVSQAILNAYISELESSGFEVARVGREPFRISSTHLRFYSDAVSYEAAMVADKLGVEARDFTSLGSASQRIEIWVQGTPLNTEVAEQKPDSFVARMLQRLNLKL